MFQRPCYSVLWAIQPYGESRIPVPTSPMAAAKVPVHDSAAGDSVEAQGPWRGGDGGASTRPTDLTRLGKVLLRASFLESLSGVFSRRVLVRHVMSSTSLAAAASGSLPLHPIHSSRCAVAGAGALDPDRRWRQATETLRSLACGIRS